MKKVGIVGFRGYSGVELIRILERHSGVEVYLMEHRQDAGARPQPLGAKTPKTIVCSVEAAQAASLDCVLLATHPDVSMDLTPGLLAVGVKVVDLSGAYRLRTVENYKRWYKEDHQQQDLLTEAVYGLPEFNRSLTIGARLVSNPGCYPTAANLAIRPLVEAGVVDLAAGIVCDAKSGVSGAGRKPSLKTSFCEVTENFSAYSVLTHRHAPEVLLTSGIEEPSFSFTAQLLPLDRGILETIYFRGKGIENAAALVELYRKRYEGEPFVRIYAAGEFPDLKSVARTNFCDIGVAYDAATGRGVVVSAIDNLVKGAAGQAIQNMNLILGFAETESLL